MQTESSLQLWHSKDASTPWRISGWCLLPWVPSQSLLALRPEGVNLTHTTIAELRPRSSPSQPFKLFISKNQPTWSRAPRAIETAVPQLLLPTTSSLLSHLSEQLGVSTHSRRQWPFHAENNVLLFSGAQEGKQPGKPAARVCCFPKHTALLHLQQRGTREVKEH